MFPLHQLNNWHLLPYVDSGCTVFAGTSAEGKQHSNHCSIYPPALSFIQLCWDFQVIKMLLKAISCQLCRVQSYKQYFYYIVFPLPLNISLIDFVIPDLAASAQIWPSSSEEGEQLFPLYVYQLYVYRCFMQSNNSSCFLQNRERRPRFVTFVLKKWDASKDIRSGMTKNSNAIFVTRCFIIKLSCQDTLTCTLAIRMLVMCAGRLLEVKVVC